MTSTSYGAHSVMDLDEWDITAIVLIGLGLAVSTVGGIGGGSIAIPLLVLMLHFTPTAAIPLGNVAVLGSSISNFLFNLRKHHPLHPSKPLIDWEVISMMEPATMLGALLGAYLHQTLPEYITALFLVLILTFTAYRMIHRGVRDVLAHQQLQAPSPTFSKRWQYQALPDDSRQDAVLAESVTTKAADGEVSSYYQREDEFPAVSVQSAVDAVEQALQPNRAPNGPSSVYAQSPVVTTAATQTRGIEIQRFEIDAVEATTASPAVVVSSEAASRKVNLVPWKTLAIIVTLFSGTCAINLSKNHVVQIFGGSATVSVVFHVILVSYIILIGVLLRERVLLGTSDIYTPPDSKEIDWTGPNSVVYPSICSLAGVIAGTFGIGGGIIKAPLLIEMGVDPMVTAATSTAMIVFTSITATSSYLVDGSLLWDYGLIFFTIGVLVNIIAQTVLGPTLAKYGQVSYITIILGVVVAISAILMTVQTFEAMSTRATSASTTA